MSAISNKPIKTGGEIIEVDRKKRSTEPRDHHLRNMLPWQAHEPVPAAGAHASRHLINEDATPGAGVLPSHAPFGREVDGGAG